MYTPAITRCKALAIFLIFLDRTLALWSSVGESQSFTCVTPKRDALQIKWYNERNNLTSFICLIFQNKICTPYEDKLLDHYNASITTNDTFVISIFTISHITPLDHNTAWLCINETKGMLSRYDLYVFATGKATTCKNITLHNESRIQVKCEAEQVFPESLCLFYMKHEDSQENISNQGYINYTQEQNLTTLYYKTTCTLVVSPAILGPGSYMFRVVFFPNITSNVAEEMKTTSDYTSSIYLAYPKVFLGTDCGAKDYIKENETSNCTCSDNSNSFLPTKIKWSTNQSIILDKGTIIFTAKRKGSFQCTISNLLNWTDQIVFQPNISYPPDIVKLNITKQVFDLCNDTHIVISGTCFVSDSNPESSITLNINNSLMDQTNLKYNGEYIFNISTKSTGIFNISCNANSMAYSKNGSSMITVIIKGPPEVPTIFKNSNKENKSQPKQFLEIIKGDTITCQAKGGYPIFKNLSLKCGTEEMHALNQDQVSLALNVSNVTSGTCKCVIWHESVCLQNTSSIQFQVVTSLNTPLTEQDFKKIYLGVGVGAGCFVVIIALIFIVSNLRQGQLKKASSDMDDKLVANEDIYFIKQEKSDIDMSIYPEYTNVVTTMSSAKEAPKNLKNKGLGDTSLI